VSDLEQAEVTRAEQAETSRWSAAGGLVLIGPALVSIAVSIYILTLPNFLTGVHSLSGIGYDDGVYLSAVEKFVHGTLPYRSYTFVTPPGPLILFTPLGLFGRWFGTADALAVGRILTFVVAAANSALAAYVLRFRGRLAQAVAGLIVAGFPIAITATDSINLEPDLILFVLIGACLAFGRDGLASGSRLVWAGVVLAFTVELKIWGIAAAAALVIACLGDWRRLRQAITGLVVGTVVFAGPFFIAAPSRFWHQVVIAQLQRKDVIDTYSVTARFAFMTGVANGTNAIQRAHAGLAVMVAVIVIVAIGYLLAGRSLTRFDWFVLAFAVLMVGGLLQARQFYDHYAYATTGALALCLGNALGLIARAVRSRGGRVAPRLAIAGGVAAFVVVGSAAAVEQAHYGHTYLAGDFAVSPDIDTVIPAGACVITEDPVLLLDANRWNPSDSHCPSIVDPFAMYVAYDKTPPPGTQPFPPALTDAWLDAFAKADWVVMSVQGSDYIPFDQQVADYFNAHYTLLSSSPNAYIYRHTTPG
jgi:hypothetical protein